MNLRKVLFVGNYISVHYSQMLMVKFLDFLSENLFGGPRDIRSSAEYFLRAQITLNTLLCNATKLPCVFCKVLNTIKQEM